MSMAPAFSSPRPVRTRGPSVGNRLKRGLECLVAAVLAPERADHAEFDGGGSAAESVEGEVVFVAGEGELLEGGVVDVATVGGR